MAQVREPALHSPLALADHNQLTIVPADEWRKVAAGPGSGGRFGRTSLCAEHASHQMDRFCILDLIRKETTHGVSVIGRYDQSPALANSVDELPEFRRGNLMLDLRRDDVRTVILRRMEVYERFIGPFVPEEQPRLGRNHAHAIGKGGIKYVSVHIRPTKNKRCRWRIVEQPRTARDAKRRSKAVRI